MHPDIYDAFHTLPRLLARRLDSPLSMSEDSVRYTFFAALVSVGVPPERIALEHDHPQIERAKTDTVIFGADWKPDSIFEFKYLRAIPSEKNGPLTQHDGSLFHDLVRLLQWEGRLSRYFVYVTDKAPGDTQRFSRLFKLAVDAQITIAADWFRDRPKTFHDRMGTWAVPATIRVIAADELPRGHYLRILTIEPVS